MNLALWIAAGALAVVFLLTGSMKLLLPRERLLAAGMGWIDDFRMSQVRSIGVVELLGTCGLVLPGLTGVLPVPVLVPLAASGLVLLMVGAIVTHARRGELANIALNSVLLLLALWVALGRFAGWGT